MTLQTFVVIFFVCVCLLNGYVRGELLSTAGLMLVGSAIAVAGLIIFSLIRPKKQ